MSIINQMKKMFLLDTAENSIMQTIALAVSSILVAAGMIMVPNIVSNGYNDRTKTDIAIVATAQDFRVANTGSYVNDLSVLQSAGGLSIKMTSQTWTYIKLTSTNGYGILGISQSGYVYVMNPKLNKPVSVGKVTLQGNGAMKTIKPNSFVASTKAANRATFTNSGFVNADVYLASKNQ